MPVDACQYFYESSICQEILKPVEGDCCVYCIYGEWYVRKFRREATVARHELARMGHEWATS